MIGYKYRAINKYSIETLLNNTIYFSRFSDFNDPFEFSTPFPDMEKMYTRIAEGVDALFSERKLSNADHAHLKKCCLNIAREGNSHRTQINELIKTKLEKIGVYSLSEINDEILMWSHYADNHRGICIGFEDLHKHTDTPSKALPINYTKDYTDLSSPEIVLDFYESMFYKHRKLSPKKWTEKYKELDIKTRFKDDQRCGISVLTDKYEKWSYEREFRLVDEQRIGLKTFAPSCLKSITFGLRTSDEDKEHIIQTCRNSSKSHVEFYQADKAPGKFQLNIRPVQT